jgi:hypothetical protein
MVMKPPDVVVGDGTEVWIVINPPELRAMVDDAGTVGVGGLPIGGMTGELMEGTFPGGVTGGPEDSTGEFGGGVDTAGGADGELNTLVTVTMDVESPDVCVRTVVTVAGGGGGNDGVLTLVTVKTAVDVPDVLVTTLVKVIGMGGGTRGGPLGTLGGLGVKLELGSGRLLGYEKPGGVSEEPGWRQLVEDS